MLNSLEFKSELTKRIKKAKATGKRGELVDGDGLYVDITPSGSATWRYRYRINDRREKITIGSCAQIGLSEARDQRAIIAGKVAAAKNVKDAASPAQEREQVKQAERSAKKAGTIADLASRYLAHIKKQGKKAKSIDWHISAYITPTLGAIRSPALTADDIRKLCDRIKNKDKAPASSREVLGTIRRMLDHGVSDGLIAANPATAIKPSIYSLKTDRERSLSPDELRAFLLACDKDGLSRLVSSALRFILLTMARKNEAIKASWSEFNRDDALWELPLERTKNKKPHMVPLSSQAMAILNTLRPEQEDEEPITNHSAWVFPGLAGKPLADSTLNEALKNNEWFGLARFSVHDLRRTASTIMHESGWNTDVIEKALNHTMTGVRGVYNRAEYLDQRREMLQAWADYLDALKEGAKVVPIGKGKAA
ncbi:MAG: tyrosine-type recombinase/integrase [Proteobacteria bacterium]|nr:tyrosine-type recombinase/integrase [Pseudomonadota bacterium]